jgi:ammonium transporter, Amt family
MDRPVIDVLWVIVSAFLVFLMQAGFLCLESGLTRSKNNINVAMKNLTDFGIATLLFWLLGYMLMFGDTRGGWFGVTGFAIDLSGVGAWDAAYFVFQAMFCGTAVTIMSGAVAERMRFGSYIIMVVCVSALVYPIFGHWAWAGAAGTPGVGWLAARGFVDFAGSTVVHSVGGWASLAAVLVIGPRTGRFGAGGATRAIPASNLPIAMLGAMLLWFGWFGFNGGSTLAMDGRVPGVIANTLLGGAAGMLSALALGRLLHRRFEVSLAINGSLAGLVAITASCHAVGAPSAALIGAVGGLIMVGLERALERLRIDDAVGAIPVHLGGGIWGTLALALFAQPERLGTGLDRGAQLLVQIQGVAACFAWAFGVTYLLLMVAGRLTPPRISLSDELIGLNVAEHGASTELLDLLNAMERQARTGDLSARVAVEPFTEVGQIAAQHNRLLEALEQTTGRMAAVFQHAQDGIVTFSRADLTILTVNPAAERIFGFPAGALAGQPVGLLLASGGGPANEEQIVAAGAPHEVAGRRNDGTTFPLELVVAEASAGAELFYVATMRDISARRQLEEERAQIQQEIIRAQAAVLAQLSTPLIPIDDRTLVMPLVGAIDSQRARQVVDTLLRGVEANGARTVILDITGVPVIDRLVAELFVRSAQMVRLLGAQLVLTGIRPEVAQELAATRADLSAIVTHSTLRHGIAEALR